MNSEKDSLSVRPPANAGVRDSGNQSTQRRGILPVWVGTPKYGRKFSLLTYLVNANNITYVIYDRFGN